MSRWLGLIQRQTGGFAGQAPVRYRCGRRFSFALAASAYSVRPDGSVFAEDSPTLYFHVAHPAPFST